MCGRIEVMDEKERKKNRQHCTNEQTSLHIDTQNRWMRKTERKSKRISVRAKVNLFMLKKNNNIFASFRWVIRSVHHHLPLANVYTNTQTAHITYNFLIFVRVHCALRISVFFSLLRLYFGQGNSFVSIHGINGSNRRNVLNWTQTGHEKRKRNAKTNYELDSILFTNILYSVCNGRILCVRKTKRKNSEMNSQRRLAVAVATHTHK